MFLYWYDPSARKCNNAKRELGGNCSFVGVEVCEEARVGSCEQTNLPRALHFLAKRLVGGSEVSKLAKYVLSDSGFQY